MKRVLLALTLAGCAHAALPPTPPAQGTFDAVGHVSMVDPFERRLTVSTPRGDMELRATDDSELVGDTGEGWMPMSDIRPGDDVRVSWRFRADGVRELTRLQVLPEKGDPPETEPVPPPRDEDAPILAPAGGPAPLPVGGR